MTANFEVCGNGVCGVWNSPLFCQPWYYFWTFSEYLVHGDNVSQNEDRTVTSWGGAQLPNPNFWQRCSPSRGGREPKRQPDLTGDKPCCCRARKLLRFLFLLGKHSFEKLDSFLCSGGNCFFKKGKLGRSMFDWLLEEEEDTWPPGSDLVLPKNLVEYTVMNIEPIAEHERHKFAGQGTISKRVSFWIGIYDF